jgi:hypothetical protein
LWAAIVRRPAFHRIADVKVLLDVEARLDQQTIEGLSGSALKRQTGLIFLRTGSFSDQHQWCFWIAPTDHHLLARCG